MSSIIWILLLLGLAACIFFAYTYWAETRKIWRALKADRVRISFLAFLSDFLTMKFRRIVPPDLIFEAFMEGKKAEISIDVDTLKNFYRIIDNKVPSEINIFNSRLIDGELRLKRLWSRFLLGGSLDEVAQIIIDQKDNNPLTVKGKFQTKSEKDFEKIANSVIAKAFRRAKDLPSDLIVRKVAEGPKAKGQEKIVKKEKTESEKLVDHFKNDLKSDLNDTRIYLSKDESHEELKKLVFKDTYKALYNSLQSGLNIQFRDIESYLNRNINIKVILELLNRLYHFDPLIDLQKFDRFILLLRENENVLRSLASAKKAGVPGDIEDLWDYHLRGGNISTMLDKRTKAHAEGVYLKITDLTEQLSVGRNVEELIEGLIKLHMENIEMSLNEIGKFQKAVSSKDPSQQKVMDPALEKSKSASGSEDSSKQEATNQKSEKVQEEIGSLDTFVQYLIRASHVGLYFSFPGLISYYANGGDILKLMNILTMAKQADLDITFDDCMKLNHDKNDISLIFEALKIKKRVGLDISKERLMNLQSAGGNMHEFAQALELSKQANLDLKPENIEADLVEGRKVKDIILAIMHARNEGLKVDYNVCIKYDRSGLKVREVVKWAIEPMVIKIDPISIVAKDAIELKLGVNITVKGKFYLYFNGSRNEVLAARVNEAMIKEVERYSGYQTVLESLNNIAGRLLLRLTARMTPDDFPEMEAEEIKNINLKEEKLNSGSAYEILDINIPIIDVDNDTLSAIKREIAELEKELSKTDSEKRKSAAHALELEAKAKLLEAKAELQLGMAEAFKKGYMNTNEYHKMKILDDNKLLSYNTKCTDYEEEE